MNLKELQGKARTMNGQRLNGAGKGGSDQEQKGRRTKSEDKLRNKKQKARNMQEKTPPDRTDHSMW